MREAWAEIACRVDGPSAVMEIQPACWALERLRRAPATTPLPSLMGVAVPKNSPHHGALKFILLRCE
jgi:hypothetical protein